MSDAAAVPAPAPDPDNGQPVSQEALSRRPRPSGPAGAASALTDTFLLHTSWTTGSKLLDGLPADIGGLVLRGAGAAAGIRTLRDNAFDKALLLDPEGYAHGPATEDEPFLVDVQPDGQYTLFPRTLEDELDAQRRAGATAALTPTGYLRAGDSDALRAAVAAAARIDRDDVIFSVPLDVAWLTQEHIAHLIAVLARLRMPKAVFIGGQFDPMRRYVHAVPNLRRVVSEAGDVAVLRTDLTGFDAMSHGAFATSLGTGGSLRHIIPPGQSPRASRKDPSPSVLVGDLMSFHKGSTLFERFANVRPPTCGCRACGSRALDTFRVKADQIPAHAHTLCTWSSWIADLRAQPSLSDRALWWRKRCAAAVAYADVLNIQTQQPDGFPVPDTLRAWAELPAWTSGATPTAGRTRRSPSR